MQYWICVSDIDAGRLAVAKSLGADHTVLVDTKDAKVLAEKIENLLGDAPNITIECSGAPPSITLAITVSVDSRKPDPFFYTKIVVF